MTDQTRLSEATFSDAAAPSVEAVILAPRIVPFYVQGHDHKCGNNPYSSAPRFLYTHTVNDTPEAISAFMLEHPKAVRAADPMRQSDLRDVQAASLEFDVDC